MNQDLKSSNGQDYSIHGKRIEARTFAFALQLRTTAQRDAMYPVPQGLMIYNTTTDTIDYWDGTQWLTIFTTAGGTFTGDVTFGGDIFFSGAGTGLVYGEIYASNNTTETTISTKEVWVQCTVFDTNGESNNATPDHAQDHITVVKTGTYLVTVSASVLSGTGSGFDGEFEVKKNNGTTDFTNLHTDRDLVGGGGDHGSISMSGIIPLQINDTVEVWVMNKTNTTNLTFEDITLSIVQVGGGTSTSTSSSTVSSSTSSISTTTT